MSENDPFQCDFIYAIQVIDRKKSTDKIVIAQEFNGLSRAKAVSCYRGIVTGGKYDEEKYAVSMVKKYVMANNDYQIDEERKLVYGDTLGYLGEDDKNYRVAIGHMGVFYVDKDYFKMFTIRTSPTDHEWKVTRFGRKEGLKTDDIECIRCGMKATRSQVDHIPKLQPKVRNTCEPKRIITL